MITKSQREELVKKFGRKEKDTGSAEVQVALLTARINDLQGHFEKHPKDNHSNRGLLQMIGKRKSLLRYISSDPQRYNKLISELGLRK